MGVVFSFLKGRLLGVLKFYRLDSFPHAGMDAGRLILAHRGDEVLGCVS